MCGILGVLNPEHSNDIDSDFYRGQYFYRGQSRGPDHSTMIEHMNTLLGFHRLAINGLTSLSNQPLSIQDCILICNGEIYNYKELYQQIGVVPTTESDCEIILHLYLKYGMEHTLHVLDSSEFAFILIDSTKKEVYVARDPYGVRPLYQSIHHNTHSFASVVKMISGGTVTMFPAGHCNKYIWDDLWVQDEQFRYTTLPCISKIPMNYDEQIRAALTAAVYKRIQCTEQPIACLLSGGLDSSLITCLVYQCRKNLGYTEPLETYSIGMKGSPDLEYAEKVAAFLGTKHTSIVVSEDEFFDSIPDVIYHIESYDTTTVRASVGNYLVSKYIRENSKAKVIFNGDGADEVTGGYLYLHRCPNALEFDKECRRLVDNIQYFDALRSDKCIASNGLESRTPFLDRAFVQMYLSIPAHVRLPQGIEKYLLRHAFKTYLPSEIIWRKKEAFSDGVSSIHNSWYQVIQHKLTPDIQNAFRTFYTKHNQPTTVEQYYYRSLFDGFFPRAEQVVPYYWMPKYTTSTDCSARTLEVYSQV